MEKLTFEKVIPLISDQHRILSLGPSEIVYKTMSGQTCVATIHQELTDKIGEYSEKPSSFVVIEESVKDFTCFQLFFRSCTDKNLLHSLYFLWFDSTKQFTVHHTQYEQSGQEIASLLPWSGIDSDWVIEIKEQFKTLLVSLPAYRLHWLTGGLEL